MRECLLRDGSGIGCGGPCPKGCKPRHLTLASDAPEHGRGGGEVS